MKEIPKIISGVLIILFSCKTDNDRETKNFPIPDQRLVDFDTSNVIIKRAAIKVQHYLRIREGNTDINDFYLDSVYVKRDTIILMVNHADHYVVRRRMMQEVRRQEELTKSGDTVVEVLWLPPTGNWSGKTGQSFI